MFAYVCFLAAAENYVFVTETLELAKPNILTLWSYIEKVCSSLLQGIYLGVKLPGYVVYLPSTHEIIPHFLKQNTPVYTLSVGYESSHCSTISSVLSNLILSWQMYSSIFIVLFCLQNCSVKNFRHIAKSQESYSEYPHVFTT